MVRILPRIPHCRPGVFYTCLGRHRDNFHWPVLKNKQFCQLWSSHSPDSCGFQSFAFLFKFSFSSPPIPVMPPCPLCPTRSQGTPARSALPPWPMLAPLGVKDRYALRFLFSRSLTLVSQLYPDPLPLFFFYKQFSCFGNRYSSGPMVQELLMRNGYWQHNLGTCQLLTVT